MPYKYLTLMIIIMCPRKQSTFTKILKHYKILEIPFVDLNGITTIPSISCQVDQTTVHYTLYVYYTLHIHYTL